MMRSRLTMILLPGLMIAALVTAGTSWAQQALVANLDPSGVVEVASGDTAPVIIELNAHGPGWQHAPQKGATAEASDLPGQAGKQFIGTLPIPNTDGGAIEYTQRVTALPQGVRLQYDLAISKTMRLNGLQVSILLPVERYAGSEVLISQPHGDPEITGLPEEQPAEGRAQLWTGSGSKVEVAAETDNAVTMVLRAATDVIVQDLRQWEHEIFEVRFPAIMEDDAREVSAEDRFHLDLTVSFAAPITLAGP